jgi:hypothetical protein
LLIDACFVNGQWIGAQSGKAFAVIGELGDWQSICENDSNE